MEARNLNFNENLTILVLFGSVRILEDQENVKGCQFFKEDLRSAEEIVITDVAGQGGCRKAGMCI